MDKRGNQAITILYYNKIRLTCSCIDSILAAGYPPGCIYCFDNGSQVAAFEEIKQLYAGCHHQRAEENRGFSGGFNRALDWVFQSGHESTLFCTNDTIIKPQALEACEKTAGETGAGLVAPLVTYVSRPDHIDSIGAYFDAGKGMLHHYHDYGLPVLLERGKEYIPGTAIWVSKDAYYRLSGTDESFHMYWEDVEMCFRAHQLGILQARCYESVIQHGGGQTCRKKPLYTTFYFQRNRIRFCRRYLENPALGQVLNHIRGELNGWFSQWEQNNDQRRLEYYKQLMAELD